MDEFPTVAAHHVVRRVTGCIYDPFRDELFTATRGNGAFLNGMQMQVGDQASIGEATVACGAPPGVLALGPCVRGMTALAPHVRTLRMLGSAGRLTSLVCTTCVLFQIAHVAVGRCFFAPATIVCYVVGAVRDTVRDTSSEYKNFLRTMMNNPVFRSTKSASVSSCLVNGR